MNWNRGFTGYVADGETGLLHARSRQYSPTLGRFVARDVLRDFQGLSVYESDMVPNGVDPTGMAGEQWDRSSRRNSVGLSFSGLSLHDQVVQLVDRLRGATGCTGELEYDFGAVTNGITRAGGTVRGWACRCNCCNSDGTAGKYIRAQIGTGPKFSLGYFFGPLPNHPNTQTGANAGVSVGDAASDSISTSITLSSSAAGGASSTNCPGSIPACPASRASGSVSVQLKADAGVIVAVHHLSQWEYSYTDPIEGSSRTALRSTTSIDVRFQAGASASLEFTMNANVTFTE